LGESYNILIEKLDEFIRKYYKNHLIRGGIYCAALLLAFFIIVNILEYFGHFGITTRTVLFYSYLLLNAIVLWRFVIISLLKLFRIGNIISDEYAAEIIGRHFTEVKDKLLNTLQLKRLNEETPNSELIRASIDQKISELKPIPFKSAVDLSINKKYIKYPLIPLSVIVIILFAAPSFLTEPSSRLIQHNVYFEKKAPFQINILNKNLEAIQQEDYRLEIKLTGNEIPDKAYIIIDNTKFQLDRENNILYHYTFRNIQKDTKFKLSAEDYNSREYLLRVLPKPIILNFSVELNYPKYTGKKDESVDNTGDLIVPEGTKATWKFYTKDTKELIIRFKDKAKVIESGNSSMFAFTDILKDNQNYSISLLNQFMKNKDSLAYTINVIKDAYPSIDVQEYHDSIYQKHLYFKGIIKDDYGFSRLTFNYKLVHSQQATINSMQSADSLKLTSVSININDNSTQQEFFHNFDISTIQIEPGEELVYYFEVWDNDGVNGPKATQSQKKMYKEPTQKEIEANSEKSNNELASDIKESIKEAQNLQNQAEDLSRKLLEKKDLNWQEKKQVEDLLERQKNLQEKMENIKKLNQQKNTNEDMYNKQMNEDLIKKRDDLQKLFDQLMTDEMKKMYNQLQEMLKKLDKDKVNQMLDKMKLSNKDIEKELNRNLQLMKQLEFEKKLTEAIDNLKDLAKKEENLSQETKKLSEQRKPDNQQQLDKQQKYNNDFKDVQNKIQQMEQKNKELEEPNKLMKTDEQQKSIQEEMQNSLNSLKSKNNKSASKSQKNASDKMGDLAQKLQEMKDQMEDEQNAEDYDKLRDLLENLVRVSFEQEDNMKMLKSTTRTDPQYVKLMSDQNDIKDELKMIEDTLFAISKRQIDIKPYVNKKITEINQNVQKTLRALMDSYTIGYQGEANRSVAVTSQQYTMTAINDLALLISESLEEMNQKMSPASCSKCKSHCKKKACKNPSSCSKPGGKKQGMKSLRLMQQAMNKKLEELKKGMNPFGNSQHKQQEINQQLARLAAEQEAIRQQLQQLSDEYKNGGKENSDKYNNLMKQMEKTETDLVNKMVSAQTLNRQKEILTRLLESEKADLEREIDNKRESTEAKNQNLSNPNKNFEYNKIKLREDEMLKTSLPTLKPFYKNKVNEYFIKFED
jgi:hypothetical protein